MDEIICDYCYSPLSLSRFNKALGCGHSICTHCIEFLHRNLNINQCPFDKKSYNSDISFLPVHQASLKLIKSLKNMCQLHRKPKLYYSKESLAKSCVNCLSEDDALEESELSQYLIQKLIDFKTHASLLAAPYETNIKLMHFLERIHVYTTAVKNFTEEITSNLYESDLDTKLNKLRKCMIVDEFPEFDNKIYESRDPDVLEASIFNNLSILALKREKRLVSSNCDNYAWTGEALISYIPQGGDGYYSYKYRLESTVPVNLIEIGLGNEYYQSEPVVYLKVLARKTGLLIELKNCYNSSGSKAKISKQYRIDAEFRIEPWEEFEIIVDLTTERVYAIRPKEEISFGYKRLYLLENSYRAFLLMYLKFENIAIS